MTTTAADTGNQFADAWTKDQWTAARAGVQTQAVAPSASNTAEQNDYQNAWAGENNGVYGDINVAPLQTAAAAPAAAPAAPMFRQQDFGMDAQGNRSYNSLMPATGAPTAAYTGGYGNFNYGDAMPDAGSDKYADYQSYFSNGGYDPSNMYGRRDASIADLSARGQKVTDLVALNARDQ